MPTYEFHCAAGHVTERLFPMSACPKSVKCACGKRARYRFAPSRALIVPFYMSAEGDDANAANDAYLKSDRVRKAREQDERIAERSERMESSWDRACREAEPKLERARQNDAERARATAPKGKRAKEKKVA